MWKTNKSRGETEKQLFTSLFAVLQVVDDLLDIGQLRLVDQVALVHHFPGEARGIRLGAERLQADDALTVLAGVTARTLVRAVHPQKWIAHARVQGGI